MKLVAKLLVIAFVLAFVLGVFRFLDAPLAALWGDAYPPFLSIIIEVVVDPVIVVVVMYKLGRNFDLGTKYASAFDSLLIGALIGGFSGYTAGFVAGQFLWTLIPSQLAFLQPVDTIQIYLVTVASSLPLTGLSLALVGFGALSFGFFAGRTTLPAQGQS